MKNSERPHIVWALFPPLYWFAAAGIGYAAAIAFMGRSEVVGIVAVFAMAMGCLLASLFAAPIFNRVCGYFERHGLKSGD